MSAAPEIGRADAEVVSGATHALYTRYGRQIYAYCLNQLRSREEAEDAVQTTFLNAFRGLQRGAVAQSEQAWIYKIAQNVCLARRQSSGRRLRLESPNNFEVLQETVASPRRNGDVELMGLEEALEAMPENQRRAILLREWQGLSYREISDELGLTQASVEMLIFRARRSLASALDEDAVPKKQRSGGRGLSIASLLAAIKSLLTGGAAVKIAVALVASAAAVATEAEHTIVNSAAPAHMVRSAPALGAQPVSLQSARQQARRSAPPVSGGTVPGTVTLLGAHSIRAAVGAASVAPGAGGRAPRPTDSPPLAQEASPPLSTPAPQSAAAAPTDPQTPAATPKESAPSGKPTPAPAPQPAPAAPAPQPAPVLISAVVAPAPAAPANGNANGQSGAKGKDKANGNDGKLAATPVSQTPPQAIASPIVLAAVSPATTPTTEPQPVSPTAAPAVGAPPADQGNGKWSGGDNANGHGNAPVAPASVAPVPPAPVAPAPAPPAQTAPPAVRPLASPAIDTHGHGHNNGNGNGNKGK